MKLNKNKIIYNNHNTIIIHTDRVAGFGVPLTGVSVGNEPVGDVGDVGAMVGRVHQIESMHTVLHKPRRKYG